MKKLLILFLLAAGFHPLSAKVKLPSLIGDHMVLQRDTVVNLWGETSPGTRVRLRASWSGDWLRTSADSSGRWQVQVSTPGAGGPYRIEIDDGERTTLEDVMIGEVWICSGQSNMALTLHGERGEYTEGSLETLLESGRYPSLRLFQMGNVSASEPQEACPGNWARPDWRRISAFSAIAYHFGRTLSDALQIPVGLISANWGASSIEAWIPEATLQQLEQEEGVRFRARPGMMKQKIPSALYNGMIHPLERYTARGFLWYQGEGNRADYRIYDKLMAEMVRSWRAGWGNLQMPFYYVELAPYRYDDPQGIDRPLLVEAQHRAVDLIPHSGIVGTLDLGDSLTIHPPRKREIGQRLGLLALTNDYRIGGIEARSPTYRAARFDRDGSVELTFDHAPYGLRAEGTLTGFEVCGADSVFHAAEARLTADRTGVRVISPAVSQPIAVRYGFRNWSRGNLYNTSGIPVLLFRTDRTPATSTTATTAAPATTGTTATTAAPATSTIAPATSTTSPTPAPAAAGTAPTPPEWDDPTRGEWFGFERVEIPSSADGKIQRAYFRLATGSRRQPLVVSLHTWSGNYTQSDPLAAEAKARNWNYIHPDFRGPNNNPEACGSALVISDLEDAVRYGVEHGNTDPDEVHVIGVSGGGYATLLAYMKLQYPVRSFSAWAPISDLGLWYEESLGRGQRYAGDLRGVAPQGDGVDTAELRRRSPLHMSLPGELREGSRLSIYEGIHDGYRGSVPITQAIDPYNRLVRAAGGSSATVSDREALRLVTSRRGFSRDSVGDLFGRRVHLRRSYGGITLTLFEGGHEQLRQALSLLPVRPLGGGSPLRIWAIGDSNGEKGDGWVFQLGRELPGAEIHNNSRSGRTIGFDNNGDRELNALRSLEPVLREAEGYFGARGCDAVVLCLGTNDAKAVFSGDQDCVPGHFRELLERIGGSEVVRRQGSRLIFVTPPPMEEGLAGEKYEGGNTRLGVLVPRLSAIARDCGWEVVDIYHPLQSIFRYYTRDGVHMDAAGQSLVARKVAERLLETRDGTSERREKP